MNTTFIYRPTTGDRVFVEVFTPHLRIVKWSNGCRHVQGGVRLSWVATTRPYWRQDGKALLAHAVSATGGIAWDEQGVLHVVVPTYAAGEVRRLVCALTGEDPRMIDHNCARILACGPTFGDLRLEAGDLIFYAISAIAPQGAFPVDFGPLPTWGTGTMGRPSATIVEVDGQRVEPYVDEATGHGPALYEVSQELLEQW
jgi:hypothetical protein